MYDIYTLVEVINEHAGALKAVREFNEGVVKQFDAVIKALTTVSNVIDDLERRVAELERENAALKFRIEI